MELFLTIKLCTYAKLNRWNRTDYIHKNGFGVKYPTKVDMPWNPTNKTKLWCYLTHSWRDTGVHTFHNGIWTKVIIIEQLEFELTLTITPRRCNSLIRNLLKKFFKEGEKNKDLLILDYVLLKLIVTRYGVWATKCTKKYCCCKKKINE